MRENHRKVQKWARKIIKNWEIKKKLPKNLKMSRKNYQKLRNCEKIIEKLKSEQENSLLKNLWENWIVKLKFWCFFLKWKFQEIIK